MNYWAQIYTGLLLYAYVEKTIVASVFNLCILTPKRTFSIVAVAAAVTIRNASFVGAELDGL